MPVRVLGNLTVYEFADIMIVATSVNADGGAIFQLSSDIKLWSARYEYLERLGCISEKVVKDFKYLDATVSFALIKSIQYKSGLRVDADKFKKKFLAVTNHRLGCLVP